MRAGKTPLAAGLTKGAAILISSSVAWTSFSPAVAFAQTVAGTAPHAALPLSGGWASFVGGMSADQPSAFSQALHLDLSNPMTSSAFVSVMGKTTLTPESLQGRAPETQARMIQSAVKRYSLKLVQQAAEAVGSPAQAQGPAAAPKRAAPATAQAKDLARIRRELHVLQAVISVVSVRTAWQVSKAAAAVEAKHSLPMAHEAPASLDKAKAAASQWDDKKSEAPQSGATPVLAKAGPRSVPAEAKLQPSSKAEPSQPQAEVPAPAAVAPAIEALLFELEHGDEARSKAAAQALWSKNSNKPLPAEAVLQVVRLLGHRDPRVRSNAAQALSWTKVFTPDVVKGLSSLLKSPDTSARRGAASLLGNAQVQNVLSYPGIAQALSEALTDADDQVRWRALSILAHAHVPVSAEAYAGLVGALKHPDVDIRYLAKKTLAESSPLPAQVLREMSLAFKQEQDPAMRILFVDILGAGKPSKEQYRALSRGLWDADASVRQRAVYALSRNTDLIPSIFPVLVRALRSPAEPTKLTACSILSYAQVPLPDDMLRLLLDTVRGGEAWESALAVVRKSGQTARRANAPVPAFVKEGLLDLLKAERDKDAKKRGALISALEDAASALELLGALYSTAVVGELVRMLPALGPMKAPGFLNSPLASLDALETFVAYLKEVREESDPADYQHLLGTFTSPSALQMKVLVSPGRASFQASGYQLPYAVPGTGSVGSQRAPVFGTVSMGSSAAGKAALLKKFEAFDELIEHNFQALGILAKNAASLDKSAARTILGHVAAMVASYELIAENKPLEARFQELSKELEALWAGLPEHGKLPKETADRVALLEEDKSSLAKIHNLHTFINYVHQGSFAALKQVADSAGAEGSVNLGNRSFSFTQLGSGRLVQGSRIADPLLKQIAAEGIPTGKAVLKDDELWFHSQLGCHSVEVHVKLGEPDEGGMLRMRYNESQVQGGSALRLIFISEVLRRLGVPSQTVGEAYLEVAWDKDHGLLSKAQLESVLPRVLKALALTRDLDLHMRSLASQSTFDNAKKISLAGADAYIAHGLVPFFGSYNALQSGFNKWSAEAKDRSEFRSKLNAELKRLGLPEIPADIAFGQTVIDERFALPIRLALARGELSMDAAGVPQRSKDYRPIEAVAAVLASTKDEEGALRLGALLTGSDLSGARSRTIGGVGRFAVERLQWLREDGKGLTAYALRDVRTQAFAYAVAHSYDGSALKALSAEELGKALEREGVRVASQGRPSDIQVMKWRRLLAMQASSDSDRPAAQGLAASSGKGAFVTGPVAFRKEGAATKGGVFVVPFTNPDDLEYMRQSAGVVTTGGGLLSHAGITTRELGMPAVILNHARWLVEDGKTVLEIDTDRPGKAERDANGLWLVREMESRTLRIHEGDIVRVDGQRGTVTPFGPGVLAGAPGEDFAKTVREVFSLLQGISAGKAEAGALAARLAGLSGPAKLEAAGFAVEEALWNPGLSGKRREIVSAVLGADRELRAKLQAWGLDLLRSRSAYLLQGIDPELTVSGRDVAKLKAQLAELGVLADTLSLDSSALQGLKSKLDEWTTIRRTIEQITLRRAQEAAESWLARLQKLVVSDLPALRAVIRKLGLAGLKDEAAKLLAKANEFARLKKEKALREHAAILPLSQVDDDFTELVGGKSAKLGQVMQAVAQAGGVVPDGFALTTEAYFRYLKESGLEAEVMAQAKEIDDYLSKADLNDEATLAFIKERSARMQELILSRSMDPMQGLGKELMDAIRAKGLEGEMFAVRSSAVQEDRQEAAFAGAAESYLYVDSNELLRKITEGWASFWLPRGIQYRWQQGIHSVELKPAVTIQKMANSKSSGVMFTVNPVTGRRDIVINAAFGLGEGIVSGIVQADQYVASRATGEETAPAVLGNKRVQVVRKPDGRGTETKPVPMAHRKDRALTPGQIRRLALIGAALEEYFGYPMDIEFGFEGEQAIILQARPVTVSGAKAAGAEAAGRAP